MTKSLYYTTIILFSLASVLVGMMGCREKALPPYSPYHHDSAWYATMAVDTSAELKMVQAKQDRLIELTRHVDSLRTREEEMLRLSGKMQEMKSMRDYYEIKYLETEDDKYRRLGNKYVDSGHYYYRLFKKYIHQ
jgi:hypothetical protein